MIQQPFQRYRRSCRHWDFPSGPPPQYQPSLKALNFGVRMGSGVFTLVWPTTKLIKQMLSTLGLPKRSPTLVLTQPQGAQLRSSNGIRCFHLSMADNKINKINVNKYIQQVVDTGTSQAVPHLSTNPALRRLTSEFEWDPVFSPQYGRQQNQQKQSCRHWDFPSGPPPQYQPSLKALNFGVRMGSGVFTLVWPTTKLIKQM
ncbi:MFS transporter (macronuclear) [Tetrahymena thermophila SB210]|uniref:MFS transporter n=1 Tax=Tetrahymena thermophila (strain SB210) TaxID=312017 RepID=W7XHE7_TETTS|nr:MFS transporter [Tetrahymena thermophila SB210]EWS73781.1 MFS transporter [Tetrahymena thermophila SB210]|eukprot:XP_012653661.1 MFS transporter [Tetrahymena thermophila SB210]